MICFNYRSSADIVIKIQNYIVMRCYIHRNACILIAFTQVLFGFISFFFLFLSPKLLYSSQPIQLVSPAISTLTNFIQPKSLLLLMIDEFSSMYQSVKFTFIYDILTKYCYHIKTTSWVRFWPLVICFQLTPETPFYEFNKTCLFTSRNTIFHT